MRTLVRSHRSALAAGALGLLGLLAVAACADTGPTTPAIPTLTGSWTLEIRDVPSGTEVPTATFELKESATGRVTGSGSLKLPHEPLHAFTVERGTHTDPDVYLLLYTSVQHSLPFRGRVSSDGAEIEGGLGMIPVFLVRQGGA